jgi:hypothetical protein
MTIALAPNILYSLFTLCSFLFYGLQVGERIFMMERKALCGRRDGLKDDEDDDADKMGI